LWHPPPPPPSCPISRGFHTERARLGTFRGFGTERARLGTFRGFGTERARLGTFRGFGTERARLGTFRGLGTNSLKKCHFFTQKEHPAPLETEVLDENLKIILQQGILKKKFSTPNFTKFLNP
jgi:hypothetical protein